MNKIIPFIVLIIGIYVYADLSESVGVIILVISSLWILQNLLKLISEWTLQLLEVKSVHSRTNFQMQITLNLNNILEHEVFEQIFLKLKEEGLVGEKAHVNTWRDNLLKSYKKKYPNESELERVKFNIKSGLLWKNDEVQFVDDIFHEVFIPYSKEIISKLDKVHSLIETQDLYRGITVRTVVLNGQIYLQIGEFPKKFSSNESGGQYKHFISVLAFPLMYFGQYVDIPTKYLNVSLNGLLEHVRLSKDRWKALSQIHNDVAQYSYLCNYADEQNGFSRIRKWDKIMQAFESKRERILNKNNFKDLGSFNYDQTIWYGNSLVSIYIPDLRGMREKRIAHFLPEYCKEIQF